MVVCRRHRILPRHVDYRHLECIEHSTTDIRPCIDLMTRIICKKCIQVYSESPAHNARTNLRVGRTCNTKIARLTPTENVFRWISQEIATRRTAQGMQMVMHQGFEVLHLLVTFKLALMPSMANEQADMQDVSNATKG